VEEQESESEVDEDLRSSHEGKNISAWFGKKKADKPERNRIAESCIVLCIGTSIPFTTLLPQSPLLELFINRGLGRRFANLRIERGKGLIL